MKLKLLILLTIILNFSFSAFAESPIPIELIENSKRVSLVFVGSKEGISESSFGHIALRFSNGEKLGIFDTNIQFVANVNQDEGLFKKYAKGTGLFGNYAYDVSVEIEPFINYQLTKTKSEDRDVYIYPLNLTSLQISNLVNYIENFFNQDTAAKYRFFNKNCSFFAADAIESATGIELGVKSHPWRLEKELRRKGLIEDEVFHPSNSTLKNSIIDDIFSSQIASQLLKMTTKKDFKESLFSEDHFSKKHAYLQLLSMAFYSSYVLPTQMEREIALSFYKKLYSTESNNDKLYYKALLNSTDDSSIIHAKALIRSSDSHKRPSHLNHSFYVKNDNPILELRWRQDSFNSKKLHMNFLDYNPEDNQIYYQGRIVGSAIFTRKENWISPTHINYSAKLLKNKIQIIFHMSRPNSKAKTNLLGAHEESIIALNNMTDFKKGYAGACYAMVKVQEALMNRATFSPESELLESEDKIKIIDQVYRGQYAIIPGFSNINDFTKSIDKEELAQYFIRIEHELNGSPFQSFKDGLLRRQKINHRSIMNFKSLVQSGNNTEMIIGMTEKGSKRFKPISHVVLVTSIEDNSQRGGWNLRVYDPNMGFYSAYMDSNFQLSLSKFYRKDLDYYGVINTIDREAIDLNLGVRSLNLDIEKLKSRAGKGKPFYYNPIKYIQ